MRFTYHCRFSHRFCTRPHTWGRSASRTPVRAIAAGWRHSLALKADGTAIALSDSRYGPVDVPANLTEVIGIAAGYVHGLALRRNGTAVACGGNDFGQTNVPADLREVAAIAAGEHHNLALRHDGTVVESGVNGLAKVPVGLAEVVAIAAAKHDSLALKQDGTVVNWCYGGFERACPEGLAAVLWRCVVTPCDIQRDPLFVGRDEKLQIRWWYSRPRLRHSRHSARP